MRSTASFVVPLALASALLVACPGTTLSPLGGECSRPGRGAAAGCRAGLTCAYGRCREDCTSSRDCALGRRCLANPDGVNVCSLETDDTCRAASDCPAELSCTRGECRTACDTDADCAGGTCSSSACTEPVSMSMPDGSPCTSDLGCLTGSLCGASRCRPACEGGCDRASRCLNVMGVLGCALPDENECTDTTDCTDGLVCVASECRTECTTDGECGPGGHCVDSSCDEPMGTGLVDAAVAPGVDAGRVAVPDAWYMRFDGGPRGSQTQLAQAFTANPLPSQTVRVLPSWISPSMPARDIVVGSMLAPIGVTLTARSDADGRGVGFVGTVDGAGTAHLFRFPGDAPSEAVDRSSDLAAADHLIDMAIIEDGAVVRGLLLRNRTEDMITTQAGWTWTEGSAPTAYDHDVGLFSYGVYTFGQATIAGGSRTIGPDQDLRYLVRERERLQTGTEPPYGYTPGDAFLSVLDVGARTAGSDRTASIFSSDVLVMRGLPDYALVWDPESRTSTMLRLRSEGGTLRTAYERVGFLDASDAPPVIAQSALFRSEAMIAAPNGPSTTLHQLSCPAATECVSEAMVFLPTPGGTDATTLAAAPLRNAYALLTVDSEGIVLRALARDLTVIPGYDDGSTLEALGQSTLEVEGARYSLLDLDAYAFAVENTGGDVLSVTLLVAGLYEDFTASRVRLWVGGVRVEIPR
ncbi:MAG: hypothetical protein K1X94_31865 [Sandaracinaceae bacterium]|nr:hypothetical protein [Sandaracinaceae bacterium]